MGAQCSGKDDDGDKSKPDSESAPSKKSGLFRSSCSPHEKHRVQESFGRIGVSLPSLRDLASHEDIGSQDMQQLMLSLQEMGWPHTKRFNGCCAPDLATGCCRSSRHAADPADTLNTVTVAALSSKETLSCAERGFVSHIQDSTGRFAFSKASVFVCHATSCRFSDLVNALEAWVQAGPTDRRRDREYFWIAAFSTNQPIWKLSHEERSTESMNIIMEIGCTISVIDPWDAPLFFQQHWCLWELFCTLVTGARLHLAMCNGELTRFREALISSNEIVRQALSDVTMSDEVSHEDERSTILTEIERSMGFHRLNETLQTRLVAFLAECAMKELKLMQTQSTADAPESVRLEKQFRNHLGRMLREQGNIMESETNFRTLLEECQALLGDEHLQTLSVKNQLAVTLQKSKDSKHLKEAEKLHRNVLDCRKQQLGELHIDTLQSMSNLAVLLCLDRADEETDRVQEAQHLFEKALSGREKCIGKDHPTTLYTAMQLGQLLSRSFQHDHEADEMNKANELLERAAQVLARDNGLGHPLTLSAMHMQSQHWFQVAKCTRDFELLVQAKTQILKVCQKRTEKLGRDHVDTLESRELLYKVRAHQATVDDKKKGRKSVMVDWKRTWKEVMPERFPRLETKQHFRDCRNFLQVYGTGRLHQQLSEQGFVDDDDNLTTGTKPFNVFARIAAGVMTQETMVEDQHMLGRFQNHFVVCCNRPELDEHWASSDPTWLGRASMSKNHRFLTTRSLFWGWFNVLVFGMLDNLPDAIELLRQMREAALLYTKTKEGWSSNIGLFFHVYALSSVNSLHLHIVDLDYLGPTYDKLKHRNISLDDVLSVLEEENIQENGKRRRQIEV